jgi:tetratricopeptide (TPR) repeat protein
MNFPNIWIFVFAFAWLLCVGSFVVYACYTGWISRGPLACLEKKKLYFLLRLSRTSALLYISVSVIAFMYFETDIFPKRKRIPDLDIQITYEQYQSYLNQRYESIGWQLNYATEDRKEILAREKTEIEERFDDPESNYERYVEWLYYQMNHLSRLQNEVPSRLLHRAMRSIAAGDMVEIDIAIEHIENFSGINEETAAMLAFMRGSLARWSLNYRQSYEHYARSTRLAGDNPKFHREAGLMAYRVGYHKASLTHYQSALAGHLEKHGENHPEVASDYTGLGMAWKSLGDNLKAYLYFEKALFVDLKNHPEDHPVIARDNSNFGLALGYLKEYQKAVPYFEKALVVNLKNEGEYSSTVMNNYEYLGWVWRKLEDYRRSATFYEKALSVCIKLYGEDHVYTANYRDTLGWLWGELREYEVSLGHYEQALGVYRNHDGENHPRVLRIQRNMKAILAWLKSRNS